MPLSLSKLKTIELGNHDAGHPIHIAQLVVEDVDANLDLLHCLMHLNGLVHQAPLNHFVLAEDTLNRRMGSQHGVED